MSVRVIDDFSFGLSTIFKHFPYDITILEYAYVANKICMLKKSLTFKFETFFRKWYRAVDDLRQKVVEYQSRMEDTERRKEEMSYQLEVEMIKNEQLTNEIERIKEQMKEAWKTQLDDLKAKIVQTSEDQMESVMRHFENKEKSLSRLLDIHEEPTKLCPVCGKSFPIDVADELFENHVMDHVEGICPICRMTKGENMSDNDFLRHVNAHYEGNE